MAGEALENGYSAREMRQLGWAVMAAKIHGGPPDEVVGHLERSLRNGETMDGMFEHMMQYGWMGSGDGHHGGSGPVDDVIGGGPGGPGGPGGMHDEDGGHDGGGHHGGPGSN